MEHRPVHTQERSPCIEVFRDAVLEAMLILLSSPHCPGFVLITGQFQGSVSSTFIFLGGCNIDARRSIQILVLIFLFPDDTLIDSSAGVHYYGDGPSLQPRKSRAFLNIPTPLCPFQSEPASLTGAR